MEIPVANLGGESISCFFLRDFCFHCLQT